MSFLEWFALHHEKFVTYTADEICAVAIAAGFPREEVAKSFFYLFSRKEATW